MRCFFASDVVLESVKYVTAYNYRLSAKLESVGCTNSPPFKLVRPRKYLKQSLISALRTSWLLLVVCVCVLLFLTCEYFMNPCIAPTSFLATGSNKQKLKMKEVIYVHKQKSRQKDKKKRVNSSEPAITYIWGCGPGSYCVDLLQWLSATKHKFKWTVCLDTFPFFSNEASSFAACLLGKTKRCKSPTWFFSRY